MSPSTSPPHSIVCHRLPTIIDATTISDPAATAFTTQHQLVSTTMLPPLPPPITTLPGCNEVSIVPQHTTTSPVATTQHNISPNRHLPPWHKHQHRHSASPPSPPSTPTLPHDWASRPSCSTITTKSHLASTPPPGSVANITQLQPCYHSPCPPHYHLSPCSPSTPSPPTLSIISTAATAARRYLPPRCHHALTLTRHGLFGAALFPQVVA